MFSLFKCDDAQGVSFTHRVVAGLGLRSGVSGVSDTSGALGRSSRQLLSALIFGLGASCTYATTVSANPQPGSCIWHADASGLYQVQADTNTVAQNISLKNTVALAMNGSDCGLWAIAGSRLHKFDRAGQKTVEVALASLDAKLDGASLAAVDLVNDTVWIANGKTLVNIGSNGQVVVSATVPGTVRAIGVSLDRSIWVLGNKQLWQYSSEGALQGSRDLHGSVNAIPKLFAIDTLGNTLWLAGEKQLTRLELSLSSQSMLNIDLPHQVSALALNPLRGDLWLSTQNDQLLVYRRDGTALHTIDLQTLNLRNVVALAFDPVSQSLWTASRDALGRFSVNGDLAARLGDRDGSAGLAAPTFMIKPAVALVRPPQNALTNNPQPTIAYSYDALCNGQSCTFTSDYFTGYNLTATLNQNPIGPFAFDAGTGLASFTPASRLPEGQNSLSAQAKDAFGNVSNVANDQFTIDTIAPNFLSLTPATGTVFTVPGASIQGSIDDVDATVILEGVGAATNKTVIGAALHFSFPVTLALGTNGFSLSVIDKAGNVSTRALSLTFAPPPPASPVAAGITIGKLTNGEVSITGKAGAVGAGLQVAVRNVRAQQTVVVNADAAGGFSLSIAAKTGDVLEVSAVNQWGGASSPVQLAVASTNPIPIDPTTEPGIIPPDPATFAPPHDPTVPTNIATGTAFLYTGPNAIQTGVNPGTIEARRVAIIRGKVMDRDGNPLPAVRIRVLHHPEFGQTYSRADGMFDLAVNGGGLLTLVYDKAGVLPAQRQIQTPWQQFVSAPDVVISVLDDKVDTIVLGAAAPMQVAQGKPVTDKDGTRQATILFPAGVSATMRLPDGSSQPLATLNVRATEYTVGPNGLKAMPGPLPPATAYTYAVELSVDEAIAAGAKEVVFSRPVPVYVDNFLNFPVGTIVPAGYYDRDKAAWVPSDNGQVVKILSISNGLAVLDVKGNGEAADAASLSLLGISEDELRHLASLYQVGKSVWRVPTPHFTPWDHNWPFAPPEDAEAPSGCDANGNCADVEQEKECDPNIDCGSVIEAENQVLGERIGIAGTPFKLNYRSDRLPGYRANHRVRIPLTNAQVPASLAQVDLEINVAGRRFVYSFDSSPNRTYEFDWDGKDVYGRDYVGNVPVEIVIGYVYKSNFRTIRDGTAIPRLFGQWLGTGIVLEADESRGEFVLRYSKRLFIRSKQSAVASQGLGGWTLDVNHMYDPIAGGTLLLGDGSSREVQDLYMASTTTAMTGGSTLFANSVNTDSAGNIIVSSDGGGVRKIGANGVVTNINGPGRSFGGTIDGEGNLYFASRWISAATRVILKYGTDGSVTRIAGSVDKSEGTGVGPALQAVILPISMVVDKQGNVYFGEESKVSGSRWVENCYVKKLSVDGNISVVVGNGTCSDTTTENGPASQARISRPLDLALDSQGNLYIATDSRVRKISADGTIRTVAGRDPRWSGQCSGTDGIPALETCLGLVTAITIDREDNLLIVSEDQYSNAQRFSRIRKVRSDGLITTVAGPGAANCSQVSGLSLDRVGPAEGACVKDRFGVGGFGSITVNANNDVIATVGTGFNLAVISNRQTEWLGLQGNTTSGGEERVASSDGKSMYIFNAVGKHVRTVDARTGAVVYRFAYDAIGRLSDVEDGDGNITTILRDAAGNATGIRAPDGQHTALTLDGSGYLDSVRNPLGETYRMTYSGSGLMTSLQSPKGTASTFTYDGSGRLTRDQNAAGGYWQLGREWFADNGFEVTLSTAMGRAKHYRTDAPPSGLKIRTAVEFDGTQRRSVIAGNGTTTTTDADGTVTTAVDGPDPRFGMQAPLQKSLSVKLPSGLTYSRTLARSVSLGVEKDPLSLLAETDTLTINGQVFTSTYDAGLRQYTATSPLGRRTIVKIDAQGRPLLEQTTGILPVNRAYDSRGRLASTTQGSEANARTVRYAYNDAGYLESVTDALDRVTRYSYDATGRVKTVTTPDSRTIGFDYDANGNLVSVTPPGRPSHGFDYNAVDLSTGYMPPALGATPVITRYEYNLDKDLVKAIRPDGMTIDYGYDSGGRLATLTAPTGVTVYGYAPNTGQLTGITAPDGINLNYTYDGRLVTGISFTGSITGTVSAAYDNFFRISHVGVNGSNISFGYDADGLLTSAGILSLARDSANGLLTGTTLGQIATSQRYDSFGQLAGFTARKGTVILYDEQYTRDKAARLSQKTTTVGGQTNIYTYTYDAAGRLTDVARDGLPAGHFEYDANGNRTLAYGISASYDDQDRLTSFGGAQYSYTANGELQQVVAGSSTTSYTYDVFGNLKQVTLPDGGKLDYLVDGRNRRVGKKVNGVLTQGFLYQGQLKPAAELDGQGNVIARFVYAGKANVPEYMVKGGVSYRIIADQLGSVRLVINSGTGQVVQRIDYDEWGNVLSDSNPGFQPFGFAGGLYDQYTGLVRFGARDYDPRTARWTAKDPIRFSAGDPSLYNYVAGDPVNFKDSSGLQVAIPAGSGAGVVGGVGGYRPDAGGGKSGYDVVRDIFTPSPNQSFIPDWMRNIIRAEPPVPDATGGEKSNTGTRQWEKPGTFDDANRDFDNMQPSSVEDKGDGVRVGELPNGDRVIVRPDSSDGRPTIEIQRPDGKRSRDKIRYCP